MERKILSSDEYYMGIAFAVRAKANCTGNRVGAVIVKNNRVISTGYNGTPEGMKNCIDGGCLRCSNPNGQFPSGTGYDLCICVHAEQNAILTAARFGISVEDSILYTTMQPCFNCA
jgi:dCMP deaminase